MSWQHLRERWWTDRAVRLVRSVPLRRGPAVGVGVGVAALAVGYVGVAAWAGGKVAHGTTVAGVDLSGLDAAAARRLLDRELVGRAARPVAVRAGEASATFRPADAGLRVDVPGTVDRLTGFSLAPAAVWHHLAGAGAVEPRVRVDRSRLAGAVDTLAATLDRPARAGDVRFTAQGADLVEPVPGTLLDRPAAAGAVRRGWLRGAPVVLPVRADRPVVAAAALRQVYEQFARPAVSGPLTVRVADRSVRVPVSVLAPLLSVRAAGGRLQPVVDGAGLARAVVRLDPGVERPARDATVDVVRGKPVVRDGRSGRTVDPVQLAAAALPALTSPSRALDAAMTALEPKTSTADVKALGIQERVSTFSTRFPVNPPRTTNIRIAARTLDGILVRPGETFSLNATLGQRTPAKGYQKAPVINGGRLASDYGGGVSQVSTTLFNAVFFAGLEVVTHKPHSFYISRYPEGREATVSWPGVDQKFRNDSEHGILVKTAVTSNEITVSFYGTRRWDISATKGPRTNVRPPRQIYDNDGVCVAQSPSSGFDVTVTRVFKRGATLVRSERFSTRYIPEDHVICGPRPEAESGSGSGGAQ